MRSVLVIGALVLLAACSAPEGSTETAAAVCADGKAALPGTGLCQAEALALIPSDPATGSPAIEGCTWVANETMLPENEALLYRAAQCNGVTTQLTFAGGARSAEISYQTSALDPGTAGQILIRLFGTDPEPQGALRASIAELPASESAVCEIRPAGFEGWPADALVIAPTAAARARMPQDEPIAACGPLGLNEDEANFWRVRQGYAAFYTLGQEQQAVDAANAVFVVRGEDGVWTVKP